MFTYYKVAEPRFIPSFLCLQSQCTLCFCCIWVGFLVCVYVTVCVCECVLGGILGGVPPLCFVSFSCLTNLPTRWGSSYQDRVCSMAKNTMCSEISTKGEGSVAFFFFFTTFMLLSMAIIVQVFESHLFFFLCDVFSFFLANWHVGKRIASFKRIFQDASPTLPSQQTAHV